MEEKYCSLVAEIGATHIGSVDRAKKLINLAVSSGADFVKFQKRDPHSSTPEQLKKEPHPNRNFSYGDTYLDHRLNLEFDLNTHEQLKDYIENLGAKYSTSVFDMNSAIDISKINPEYIKIPSAANHDRELINYCINNFKQVQVSTGMCSVRERDELFSFLQKKSSNIIIYHCTSEYPCVFDNLFLNEITNIINCGFECGFSNHGYGIASDIAAYTLGATWIERHFIDDRSFRHTDASASLEPHGFSSLRRDLNNVEDALKFRGPDLTEEEKKQRAKLRVS
jgi:N-acetylneuraminate synthase